MPEFSNASAAFVIAGDDLVPRLLDAGSSPLGSYIVSEWKPGSVAADTFRELRTATNSRAQLLRLAIALVEAFERLHQRGIVHGDIQPKNVIFDLQGRVWIIDFSLSAVPGLPPPGGRMGVPFFFEPEYAKCLLEEPPKPQPLSIRGENYAVAAMVFYLLSGVHSLRGVSLDKDTLLRQIADADPRSLVDPAGANRMPRIALSVLFWRRIRNSSAFPRSLAGRSAGCPCGGRQAAISGG